MSAPLASGRTAAVLRRGSGLLFLLVLAGLIGLSIAFYQKAFTPVVRVSLEADRVGNQLSAPTDVKVRGLIVGEVREVTSTGSGATLELALDPKYTELLPANVRAELIPKTLFGEKYVSLVLPPDPSPDRLAEGDVITQDRTQTARETEQALNNLQPLLQALRPQDVSVTLNAVSGALRGRGNRLGENLVLLDDYLKGLNPEIPTLGEDFRGVADLADTLTTATPDLVTVLDNLSFVNRSLVDQEKALSGFLASTTGVAGEAESFLAENEARLVSLAADSLPGLELFARYSPEFRCLAEGLVESNATIGRSFGGLQPGLHITLELVDARPGFRPGDEPRYREDRGPDCYGLPNPQRPMPDINFQDGYLDGNPPEDSTPPEQSNPPLALASPAGQRAAMRSMVAPVLGVPPEQVPDLAYLLFGPMARGTAVGLS